jgi:hypothetical protein
MSASPHAQTPQAQQAPPYSAPNLNDLPAEIIQEIAHHLAPDALDADRDDPDDSDIEYDRMSVTSLEYGEPNPKVMPCCRKGDEKVGADESRIPVFDARSIFSATSRRIRDAVFSCRQTRRRTVRYCQQWIQETQQLPESIRSRYT